MSEERGFIGMDEFKANLQKIHDGLSGPGLRDALYAGAEVFRSAIQSSAPIGREEYSYQYKGRTVRVRSKRAIGQAKENVIVYQRKRRSGLMVKAEDISLLVGFSKKNAFYMYWMEYGRKGQAASPFMRSAYDSAQPAALAAASAILSAKIDEVA